MFANVRSMSDKGGATASDNASKASAEAAAGTAADGATAAGPAKRPTAQGNPAFRMMGSSIA